MDNVLDLCGKEAKQKLVKDLYITIWYRKFIESSINARAKTKVVDLRSTSNVKIRRGWN